MQIIQRVVSPADAGAWLENNDGNRKLRPTHVDFLTRIITSGQWQITHQGIAIGKSGRLLDGQHRLRAVIKANMSVPMMVATGVDDVTYKAMDAGVAPRTMSELLNTERRPTSCATTMMRLLMGVNKSQTHEIEIILECFSKELPIVMEFVRARTSKRTSSSPIAAAAVLRLKAAANKEIFPDVLDLVRRGILGDLIGAPPVTVSFFKQITEGPTMQGGNTAAPQFARAWVAFNPANIAVQRIQINDALQKVSEAKPIFHEATGHVFR